MTAATLVVWRHGRTNWNHERRMQGQADIPLDDVGRQQAARAAEMLVTYSPTRLVTSDLSRAEETAKALAIPTGLEIERDPDLREVDTGSWEGLRLSDVRDRFPQQFARIEAYDPDVRRGGDGESLRELAGRMEKALRRLVENTPDGETLVAASHGMAAKVGIARLLGLPDSHWNVLGGLDNCSWAVLERRGDTWRVSGWNLGAGP